eukprot:1172165-Rhodomonas_salina.2
MPPPPRCSSPPRLPAGSVHAREGQHRGIPTWGFSKITCNRHRKARDPHLELGELPCPLLLVAAYPR